MTSPHPNNVRQVKTWLHAHKSVCKLIKKIETQFEMSMTSCGCTKNKKKQGEDQN